MREMRTLAHLAFGVSILACAFPAICGAQDCVITSFCGNGSMSFTGVPSGSRCEVQWASSLADPQWKADWDSLRAIITTGSTTIVKVPMFYRVVAYTNVDLLAHYTLDGDAQDSSTHANHGTLVGPAPATNRFGVAGKATCFDGANDYILVPNSNSLNITGTLSIAVWLKPESQSGARTIIGKSDYGVQTDFILRRHGDGKVQWEYNGQCYTGAGAIPDNTWSHCVVTAEGSGADQRRAVYLNGAKVAHTTASGPFSLNTSPVSIGAAWYWSAPGSEHFQGCLDDLRIYNRELTQSEVTVLYSATE